MNSKHVIPDVVSTVEVHKMFGNDIHDYSLKCMFRINIHAFNLIMHIVWMLCTYLPTILT